jgi:hypothetical protein
MIIETYREVATPDLSAGAALDDEYPGFLEDYLVLVCLLRRWRPRSILESCTHLERGMNILCCAVPSAMVHSLDLPYDQCDRSQQHVADSDREVAQLCPRPYCRVWGDSLTFDFASPLPIEAAQVDGEHDCLHVAIESRASIRACLQGIVYHDTDMPEVAEGHSPSLRWHRQIPALRVIDTRIAYAERVA